MEELFPMSDGLYRGCGRTLPHASWAVQQYAPSMHHGLYSNMHSPMHHGLYNGTSTPWVMGCTMVYPSHASWAVQHWTHPMGHGLYNSSLTPWIMGCTTGHMPHGSWTVQ